MAMLSVWSEGSYINVMVIEASLQRSLNLHWKSTFMRIRQLTLVKCIHSTRQIQMFQISIFQKGFL